MLAMKLRMSRTMRVRKRPLFRGEALAALLVSVTISAVAACSALASEERSTWPKSL